MIVQLEVKAVMTTSRKAGAVPKESLTSISKSSQKAAFCLTHLFLCLVPC